MTTNPYNLTPARLARAERLAPEGVPRWVRIYDNGGETADRYTIVYTGHAAPERSPGRTEYPYRGASSDPFCPQGFGQWGSSTIGPCDTLRDRAGGGQAVGWPPAVGRRCHLGRRIIFDDLPPDVKRLCWQDYAVIWGVPIPVQYRGTSAAFRPKGHPLAQVTRCPHCHARGFVDLPAHPSDWFDCRACFHTWEMTPGQRARMRT